MINDILLYDKYDYRLAQNIAKKLQINSVPYEILKFNNGELFAKVDCNVKGKNIFILVKTSKEIQNFQNIIFVVSEVYNKEAKYITVITFYIPYLRQFSDEKPRNISDIIIKTVLDAGANNIITLDPHCKTFLKNYKDHVFVISAKNIFIQKIKNLKLSNFCFFSPDFGAKELNSEMARYFNKEIFIAKKIRNKVDNRVEEIILPIQNIPYKNIIIADDMIDSGQTMQILVDKILEKNPNVNIFIFCSHLILSNIPPFIGYKQIRLIYSTNSLNNRKIKSQKIILKSLSRILVDFIVKFKK